MTRALGLVALFVVIGAVVWGLRSATMSSSTPPGAGGRTEVVVDADVIREPPGEVVPMTRALVDLCRLEVASTIVDSQQLDEDRFRFVLEPALNNSDQRELRGCLQDARVRHLLLEVLRLRPL